MSTIVGKRKGENPSWGLLSPACFRGLKGSSAATTPGRIRIKDPEASTRKAVGVIKSATIQMVVAFRINGNDCPSSFCDHIAIFRRSQIHCILKPGTPPFFHRQAEPLGAVFSRQFPKMSGRFVRNLDHGINLDGKSENEE